MTKTVNKYYEGLGRRKNAVSRVRLFDDGKSQFFVNGKAFEKYFMTEELRLVANRVINELAPSSKLSISAKISGGGIHGQAEALSHSIARALLKLDSGHKPALRKSKYLTRDARIKERRKFGLKKARKAPQWSKR